MRLKELFCTLRPLNLYSMEQLLTKIKPGLHFKRRRGYFRERLHELAKEHHFPALGDGSVEGNIAWFGFRFTATLPILPRPRLPIFDHPVWPCDLAPHMDRYCQVKLELMPNRRIDPEQIHPFMIAIVLWKPLRFQKKMKNRPLLQKRRNRKQRSEQFFLNGSWVVK